VHGDRDHQQRAADRVKAEPCDQQADGGGEEGKNAAGSPATRLLRGDNSFETLGADDAIFMLSDAFAAKISLANRTARGRLAILVVKTALMQCGWNGSFLSGPQAVAAQGERRRRVGSSLMTPQQKQAD